MKDKDERKKDLIKTINLHKVTTNSKTTFQRYSTKPQLYINKLHDSFSVLDAITDLFPHLPHYIKGLKKSSTGKIHTSTGGCQTGNGMQPVEEDKNCIRSKMAPKQAVTHLPHLQALFNLFILFQRTLIKQFREREDSR